MHYLVMALLGLVSGLVSAMFGVGGGIIIVPVLVHLLGWDFKAAVGTSLAVIIPTALTGAAKHFEMGHVQWKTALIVAPLAILGAYLGAKLTGPIASEHLKRAFGGFLILVGVYTAFFK